MGTKETEADIVEQSIEAHSSGRRKRRRSNEPATRLDSDFKCGVCGVNDSKYKCPKCKVFRYCSADCYKKHKENTDECVPPQKKRRYSTNEPVSVTGYSVSEIQYKLLHND